VRVFADAGCEPYVVVGCGAERIVPYARGARIIENARWRSGQFSSVRRGIAAALKEGARRVLIQPVDVPLVKVSTVRVAARALGKAQAVVVTHGGLPGHPLGLDGGAARDVLRWDVPHLEAALRRLEAIQVEVADPGVLQELDTPAEYEAWFGRLPVMTRAMAAGADGPNRIPHRAAEDRPNASRRAVHRRKRGR